VKKSLGKEFIPRFDLYQLIFPDYMLYFSLALRPHCLTEARLGALLSRLS